MKYRFVLFRTVHFLVVLFVVISPFVASWKIITLIALINYIVFGLCVKKCPLTEWQFGENKQGFVQYYLEMLGIKLSDKQNVILMRYTIPIAVVIFSYYWQEILKG